MLRIIQNSRKCGDDIVALVMSTHPKIFVKIIKKNIEMIELRMHIIIKTRMRIFYTVLVLRVKSYAYAHLDQS